MTVKNTDLNSFTGQVCLIYYNMSSNPYDVCHIPEIQPIGPFTKLVPYRQQDMPQKLSY